MVEHKDPEATVEKSVETLGDKIMEESEIFMVHLEAEITEEDEDVSSVTFPAVEPVCTTGMKAALIAVSQSFEFSLPAPESASL